MSYKPPSEGTIPRDPSVWDVVGKERPEPEPQEGVQFPSEYLTQGIPEPETPPAGAELATPVPYENTEIALDGWEYHVARQWLGDPDFAAKKAELLQEVLRQYDPSASATLADRSEEYKDSADPYTWIFRFGLYGDPEKVTKAIETIDDMFFDAAGTWEVKPGTAKAVVKRMDGTADNIQLPSDLLSRDIANSLYRLIELVQEANTGIQADTDIEGTTSRLRQTVGPSESQEPCKRHGKPGSEHTPEERDEDIWHTKGEQWHPDLSYRESPWGVESTKLEECLSELDSLMYEDVTSEISEILDMVDHELAKAQTQTQNP